MPIHEFVDDGHRLRTCLALDDAIADGDGEVVCAATHVDVRRVMVEGVNVNQDALNDEYLTHEVVIIIVYVGKYTHIFVNNQHYSFKK